MTRVMIAVDGSELDAPLARTAHRIFGDRAEYWAVNVRGIAGAAGAVPPTVPAMYGGALVGFGAAYPILASDPHSVRGSDAEEGIGLTDAEEERAHATAQAAVDAAGITGAEHVAEVGDPSEAILRAATEHDIDVIVVGDHDRSWWSKLFAPAVATELVDRADFPVLVVSRNAADPSPLGETTR